ncbi:MAG: bifunctional DNA-formamidopyrimidine glycosylase/DNA-(apurinic or apyrimidinic site) lyase [Gemmatimonadales bacterium]
MPELPEVELGARLLREASAGRTITAVTTHHPGYARSLPPADAARAAGHTIADVTRRGKHMLATLDDDGILEFHFGMTGEWVAGTQTSPAERFARLTIDFSDGSRITLADSRALGTARYHAAGTPVLADLGPEPLSPDFSAASLGESFRRRRGPVKVALLDQSVVAGLGNIYAAEALWLARIDPRTSAAALGPVRRARLVQAIRHVLKRAPAARYTDRENGARQWRVYDREGKPCRRCGSPIKRIVQATRSTYYCPHCQRR